jgi:hypothetical protein
MTHNEKNPLKKWIFLLIEEVKILWYFAYHLFLNTDIYIYDIASVYHGWLNFLYPRIMALCVKFN